MASVDVFRDGTTVYIDTAPLIYVLQNHPAFAPLLEPLFLAIDAGRITAVSSYLTLTELLVKPFELGRADLAGRYRRAIARTVHLVPIAEEVSIGAASIRAQAGVRLADAVHLATAKLAEADVFLTNDVRLKSFRDLRVLTVSELS